MQNKAVFPSGLPSLTPFPSYPCHLSMQGASGVKSASRPTTANINWRRLIPSAIAACGIVVNLPDVRRWAPSSPILDRIGPAQ